MPADDTLSPDDPWVRRRLDAARGYCELHLPDLAWEELTPLRSKLGHAPEVLETELMILMLETRWNDALGLASKMQNILPDHPAGWLQAAFCLHELGRTREALDKLVSGPRGLRQVALFHYNCGCNLTVLGQLRDAMAALRRAFEMDASFRDNARTDPDLVPLRDQL
jgi:hypothetical protein